MAQTCTTTDDPSKLTRQLSLDLKERRPHGGARAGAGRKGIKRSFVAHRTRPMLRKYDPVHVTVRTLKSVPSLRRQLLVGIIERALLAQKAKLAREGKTHFQLVDFSIQADHLHLIVESPDKRGLARGIAGLEIRLARRINKAIGRTGRFWSGRYHRHDLRNPTEVRNALRYVLLNIKKHAIVAGETFADPYSSATSFDGFTFTPIHIDDALQWPRITPRTWLLRIGWRHRGLIDPADAPWSAAA